MDGGYHLPEIDIFYTSLHRKVSKKNNFISPTAICFAVEIAEETLAYDLCVKSRACAAARIPRFWVWDIHGKMLHIFNDPVKGKYQSHRQVEESKEIGVPFHYDRRTCLADLRP